MKELEIVDADVLLYSPLNQIEFVVDEILPIGFHLFCGASKVGKSWFMLKVCLQVSKGEPMWEFQTKAGDVLYLCLEDTLARIQNRLFKLTNEANNKLHFAISTNKISNGFLQQLQSYIEKYPNTKLIVIDTLQKIRNTSNDISYASDYGDISILKEFADKNKIAVVAVHHTRKLGDSDVFNKVSGTNGIMGSSDTTFILERKARTDSTATLYITGRDVEYQELILKFDKCNWELVARSTQKELEEQNTPIVIYKVINFMKDKKEWRGSATELLQQLNETEIAPSIISKILNEYHLTKLADNNIKYATSRDRTGRQIILARADSCDSCDSYPEINEKKKQDEIVSNINVCDSSDRCDGNIDIPP